MEEKHLEVENAGDEWNNPEFIEFVSEQTEQQNKETKSIIDSWKPIMFSFRREHFDTEEMFLDNHIEYRLPFHSVIFQFDEPFRISAYNDSEIFAIDMFLIQEDDENCGLAVYVPITLTSGKGNKLTQGIFGRLFMVENWYYSEKDDLFHSKKNTEPSIFPNNALMTRIIDIEEDLAENNQREFYKLREPITRKIKCFCENMIRYLNDNQKNIVFVDRYPRRTRHLFNNEKPRKSCAYIPLKGPIEIKPLLKRIKEAHDISREINQRKGHYVTYRSERYKNVQGKTVWRNGFIRDYLKSKNYVKIG